MPRWHLTGWTAVIVFEPLKFSNIVNRSPAVRRRQGETHLWPEPGQNVYLWMKRKTPNFITRLAATKTFTGDKELLEKDYIRVDVDLNPRVAGPHIFTWFLLTTQQHLAITELQVSISKEEDMYRKDGYFTLT